MSKTFASALAGILFGFSALMMLFNKEEWVSAALLGGAGVLMIIHALRLKNKKTTCNQN